MNDRLIEFRAWDKFEKKMISWDECLNNEDLIPEILLNSERYEPMQCTGLKDKNGLLIYENDYLKIGDEIFRVFWNSTKISLENMLKNDIIDMQKNYIMEIVGNAHEERDIR